MNLPEAYKLYANVNIVVQQNILIEHKDIVDLLCDFQMLVFEQYHNTKTRQQKQIFILLISKEFKRFSVAEKLLS